jgi:hypothetical protein
VRKGGHTHRLRPMECYHRSGPCSVVRARRACGNRDTNRHRHKQTAAAGLHMAHGPHCLPTLPNPHPWVRPVDTVRGGGCATDGNRTTGPRPQGTAGEPATVAPAGGAELGLLPIPQPHSLLHDRGHGWQRPDGHDPSHRHRPPAPAWNIRPGSPPGLPRVPDREDAPQSRARSCVVVGADRITGPGSPTPAVGSRRSIWWAPPITVPARCGTRRQGRFRVPC